MRALVVDDSTVMRKVLMAALGRADIVEVDQVADGAEALKALDTAEYGLVLMDWHLPGMPGTEVLQAIRATGKTLPVLVVISETEKDQAVGAVKAGARSYVIKPFDPQTLVRKIQDALTTAAE